MKMVKKVLFGLVVLGTVLALTSCGGKPGKDDEEGAIKKGLNNNWTVNYENTDAKNLYRAYRSTDTKHAGTLVRVQFDAEATTSEKSKMGLIFNHHYTDNDKNTQNFFIIGIAPNGEYYVSEYRNIDSKNIQGTNFGVDDANVKAKASQIDDTKPAEIVIKELHGSGNKVTLNNTYESGKNTAWIWFQAAEDGTYSWSIETDLTKELEENFKPNGKDTETKDPSPSYATTAHKGTMKETGYTSDGKVPQNGVSVYAQVYNSSTLKGEWKFIGFYKEAEDAE